MSVKVKAILPKKFNNKSVNEALEALMHELTDDAKEEFKRTTASWKKRAYFEKRVRVSLTRITGKVTTYDRLYRFIDKGTAVGYAEMSKDWKPKTVPGVIGSFPGSGRRLRLNFHHPRRGVIARNFTGIIEEKFQAQVKRRAPKVMREAAKASNHAIR